MLTKWNIGVTKLLRRRADLITDADALYKKSSTNRYALDLSRPCLCSCVRVCVRGYMLLYVGLFVWATSRTHGSCACMHVCRLRRAVRWWRCWSRRAHAVRVYAETRANTQVRNALVAWRSWAASRYVLFWSMRVCVFELKLTLACFPLSHSTQSIQPHPTHCAS